MDSPKRKRGVAVLVAVANGEEEGEGSGGDLLLLHNEARETSKPISGNFFTEIVTVFRFSLNQSGGEIDTDLLEKPTSVGTVTVDHEDGSFDGEIQGQELVMLNDFQMITMLEEFNLSSLFGEKDEFSSRRRSQ
ncbi:hypothetical protein NE237_011138 [Protea cynaroides]|uniref:Uncharacterized protein n=1 Tax=Protea cynaroides TaxID=273540 RepID=A0A9Q0GXL7_9MAGN|nr:hypothetical protein NE237_011138 [Protea cynaroides]